MDNLSTAAVAGAMAAFFTLLNTAITVWHNRTSTKQRARIERKVDDIHRLTTDNGHNT